MKKHLSTIIIVFIICIACGLGAFLLSGQLSKIEKEIAGLREEVRVLDVQANRLTTEKQVLPAGINLDELNEYLVSSDGALGFVEYIENLATSAGLTYRINQFDSEQNPDAAKNDTEFLKTSLTTTGPMKNTRNFISLIESLPYNVRITRIDLKGGGAISDAGSKDSVWTMMLDFGEVKTLGKN